MEGTVPVSADRDDEGNKLVPEWGRDADDQVVLVGLGVVVVLAIALAWPVLSGTGDEAAAGEDTPTVQSLDEVAGPAPSTTTGPTAAEPEPAPAPPSTAVPSTAPTSAAPAAAPASDPVTEVAGSVVGGVRAALTGLPGAIEVDPGDGSIRLTGYVANDAERRQAEQLAASIEGVTEIRNELVLLEPGVTRALEQSGVAGATAIGIGTSITVSGTVASQDERQAALAAARAVPGVTEIIDDRLNLEVITALNALPRVDFATGSVRIPEASEADLDRAAAMIRQAGAVAIELQGYTDTTGLATRNLRLSQARADAVRTYLLERGIGEATLTATGFGETERFGEDPGANRVVRFSQIDE